MVRLGIGLYGVDLTGEIQDKLAQVSTLETTIAQIREVKPDETVGYSRSGKVEKNSRIGVADIGYADGLDRHLGNRNGYMLVNGQRAPIIGNICMDMCMLDLTGIEAQEGDTAIVFGPDLPIHELAAKIGTIPYEVLTNVSQRVKRIYHYD
jgi:alanine racemase